MPTPIPSVAPILSPSAVPTPVSRCVLYDLCADICHLCCPLLLTNAWWIVCIGLHLTGTHCCTNGATVAGTLTASVVGKYSYMTTPDYDSLPSRYLKRAGIVHLSFQYLSCAWWFVYVLGCIWQAPTAAPTVPPSPVPSPLPSLVFT